jgi:hypothetical protein
VPAPVRDTVDPDTVQMPALVTSAEKTTERPELAVAVTEYAVPPTLAPDGAVDVKLIDCVLDDAGETVKDCCTCGAAW